MSNIETKVERTMCDALYAARQALVIAQALLSHERESAHTIVFFALRQVENALCAWDEERYTIRMENNT